MFASKIQFLILKLFLLVSVLALSSGCSFEKSKRHNPPINTGISNDTNTSPIGEPIPPNLNPSPNAALSYPFDPLSEKDIVGDCVQIFFDRTTIAGRENGKLYALMVSNLIGHFPEVLRVISPIELYRKGDMERCESNFYISSYFGNAIPGSFITDFLKTTKKITWMGYNFWTLGSKLEDLFGVQFDSLVEANNDAKDVDGNPSFFQNVIYKGEVFQKHPANPEVAKLRVIDANKHQVLAKIKNPVTGEELPWAIRSGNRFLMTEVPLSYIHEADRYLVFADLLFDMLGKSPRHQDRYAVIRLEDIHANIDLEALNRSYQTLKAEKVTPHLSMIPIFSQTNIDDTENNITITQNQTLMNLISKFKTLGSSFIWHGVTHQTDDQLNPTSGLSGDDFEFWDYNSQSPLAQDSTDFIINRLEKGSSIFKQAGITPKVWLTPHYAASSLDNIIFSQVFPWSMGRIKYYAVQEYGRHFHTHPEMISFPSLNESSVQKRAEHLSDLVVLEESVSGVDQYFPYEVYQDVYGQSVFPENLGHIHEYNPLYDVKGRSVDDILSDAKRNRVLRDVWASAFIHPFLLHGETLQNNKLRTLIKGLKNLGYKFVNLDQFVNSSGVPKNQQLKLIDLEALRL